MPRIARVVAVGLPHHVTQRGNNRSQVFFDDDDRRFYLWTLAQYRRKYGVEIWGYCLMDNHMHALAVPRGTDSLARCFAGTNLIYTQHVNRKNGRSGRLWQNRFFSCPVDKDEYLWPVLRYIDRNPVRVGLVRKAWEYSWSSVRHRAAGEADLLLDEPDWLTAALREQKYRSYLRSEPEAAAAEIRRMTATGRPLGGNAFLATLESRLGRVLSPQKPGRHHGITGKQGKCPYEEQPAGAARGLLLSSRHAGIPVGEEGGGSAVGEAKAEVEVEVEAGTRTEAERGGRELAPDFEA